MERNYIAKFEGNEWLFKADNKDVSIIEDLTNLVPVFNVKKAFTDSSVNFNYLYAIKNLTETGETISLKVEPLKDGKPDVKITLMIEGENCFSFYGKAIDKFGQEVAQNVIKIVAIKDGQNQRIIKCAMTSQQIEYLLKGSILHTNPLWAGKNPISYIESFTYESYTGPCYSLQNDNYSKINSATSNTFEIWIGSGSPNSDTFKCESVEKLKW